MYIEKKNINTHNMGLALSKPKMGRLLDQSLKPLVLVFGLIILQCQTCLIDVTLVLIALD